MEGKSNWVAIGVAIIGLIGVLGAAVIGNWDKLFPDNPPGHTKSPPANSFQGLWVNRDPNTRGITKLEIEQDGAQFRVHAWGKCHPTDCDWGVEKGALIGDEANVTWDQKFVLIKMALSMRGASQLHVVTDSVFNDDRPRQRSEESFVKQF